MEKLMVSKPRVCFEFEVEKIIGVSSDGNYQVQWAPAWVSKFHLVGCEHLIQEFLREQSVREISVEGENQHRLPYAVDAMNGSEESRKHLEKPGLVVNAEPELQHELPYLSNEVEESEPQIHELLEEQSVFELKPDPEILLKVPYDNIYEEEVLSEKVQRTITMGLHESNDGTAMQPLNLETDPPNTTELTVSDSPDSNGVNNLLVVKDVKHEDDHELRYLTNEKPSQFICNICHNKFSSGHDLEKHVAVHFNEAETSGTGTSSQKSNHNEQMYTHTSVKLFSCNQCDYSCRRKGDLAKHLRAHSGEKPFSCNQCDYSCMQKSALTQHLRTHTVKKPFSCNQCDYSSGIKSHLVNHILTHTGERPYSCEICGKSFSQKGHSISHMRTHTGDKPFSCEICGRKFTRADIRNRHTSLCLDIAKQASGSNEIENLR